MKSSRSRHSLVLLVLVLIAVQRVWQEKPRVTRVDSGVVTDLSGRWNDTDSRMVAESMVKEALEYPWLNNFCQSKRRQPVVVVGTVHEQQPRTYQCPDVRDRSWSASLRTPKKLRLWQARASAKNFGPSAKNKRCTRERTRRKRREKKSAPII